MSSNGTATGAPSIWRLRDAARCESHVAIKNEVLAKVLCHNLVVVIHELHELGIDPVYCEGTPSAAPITLKFPSVA